MPDLHFPAEIPVQCVRDLIVAVRAGEYTATATVDHALYAAGCCNALRESFPVPFGDGVEGAAEKDDAALCDAIESEMPSGFGSSGDAAAISPILLTLISELVFRVLRRVLDR